MATKACFLEAGAIESEKASVDSPNNTEKHDGKERLTENSRLYNKECLKVGTDELFENVPELKNTFVIQKKIGEGTFSNVYLAHLLQYPDEMFALKHIIPTSSPDRVEREVRCLQEMGGKDNVIGYRGAVRHCDHNVIILPYFPHDRFQDYLHAMTVSDIQDYMKNLMLALKHIHSFSIIHRDIKPGNFLHSRKLRRYNLVDFGLAMHEPDSEHAWDIEKKNDKYNKSSDLKHSRQLSPESIQKTAQITKKLKTNPRVAVTSHKLIRQSGKETARTSILSNTNKTTDSCANSKNRGVKFVSPNEHEKKFNGKSSAHSLRGGLCQTKHQKNEICTLCIKRASQSAPRAGTSGFRAPEVLLKYPQQTTAVDVWSAGIIMLCLLSGKYPFFRCGDDMTALAQIIVVFGKQRVMECTKHLGKYLVTNSTSPGYELKDLCQKLRATNKKRNEDNSTTKCCSSCKNLLSEDEIDCKASSAASNLRRTRVPEKEITTLHYPKYFADGNNKVNGVRDKVTMRKTSPEKNVSQAVSRTLEVNNDNSKLKEQTSCTPEHLRTGHPEKGEVDEQLSKSIEPRSRSVSGEKTRAVQTKVRFLSVGNHLMPEKFGDVRRGNGREHLDGSHCRCDCGSCLNYVPSSVYDLLERCLDLNPATRITASEALWHPFLRNSESLESKKQETSKQEI